MPSAFSGFPGSQMIRQEIASRISAVFNDRSRGERPIQPQTDALFPPDSIVRQVHGDVVAMTVGGLSALLLQMLHPAVLAGVWDHSNFREDMHGRLRRTARFIAVTTYAHRHDGLAAIARVRAIHERIDGMLPNGTAYFASDPALLAWVHLTETSSFLQAWRRFANPGMKQAERDRYFAEMARIGHMLGADPVPMSEHEARRQINRTRGVLRNDERSSEVCRLLLAQQSAFPGGSMTRELLTRSAVDLLPFWARRMHGLSSSGPAFPLIGAATYGAAETIRWAFRSS
ncbi:oxygenase MpaB family protein [Tanticharoenia sakaeratensis]|nr:oxygenase MpaB family protein [Tanticharoenia sakaeratensis]